MRKIFSFMLAIALMCSLVVSTVSAVDVSISGVSTGYDAYKIMDLSQSVKPGHSDAGDCEADGCDKTGNPSGHWNYAYSINEKYKSGIMAGLSAVDIDASLLDDAGMIAEIEAFDNEQVRMFADALYLQIKSLEPEYNTSDGTLSGIDPGYYLIAEKGNTGIGDSVSLVMLDTAGMEDVTVKTKEDVPELDKELRDWSIVTYVGDTVSYALEGYLPDIKTLDVYENYKFVFHDDVSPGLKIVPGSVKCFLFVKGEAYPGGGRSYGDGDAIMPDTILIRDSGDNMLDESCDLEVVFNDVKQFEDMYKVSQHASLPDGYEWYNDKTKIVVVYDCYVDESVVAGPEGNPNTAHLEFSNNPYVEDSTGRTPDDKETVFSFGLAVDKTDSSGNPLSGAEFTLYKYCGAVGRSPFLDDDGPEWWLEFPVPFHVVEGSNGTKFEVTGLSDGRYKLVETKVPDGYQKFDDIFFVVSSRFNNHTYDYEHLEIYVEDAEGNSLTDGEDAMFRIDKDAGMIHTTVVNGSGVKLPSTGGMGVSGLYIIGLGAVMLGVMFAVWETRRRRSSVS